MKQERAKVPSPVRIKRLAQMCRSVEKRGFRFSSFCGVRSRDYEFGPKEFAEIAAALSELAKRELSKENQ